MLDIYTCVYGLIRASGLLVPLAIEAESSEQCSLGTLLALTLAAAYVRDLARPSLPSSEVEDRSTSGDRQASASQLINSTSGLMLLKGAAVAIQYSSAVSCNFPLIDSVEQVLANSLQAMSRDIFYDYLQKGESVYPSCVDGGSAKYVYEGALFVTMVIIHFLSIYTHICVYV